MCRKKSDKICLCRFTPDPDCDFHSGDAGPNPAGSTNLDEPAGTLGYAKLPAGESTRKGLAVANFPGRFSTVVRCAVVAISIVWICYVLASAPWGRGGQFLAGHLAVLVLPVVLVLALGPDAVRGIKAWRS